MMNLVLQILVLATTTSTFTAIPLELFGCPNMKQLSRNCVCREKNVQIVDIRCRYDNNDSVDNIYKGDNTLHVNILDIAHNNLSDLPWNYFQGIDTIHALNLTGNLFKSVPGSLREIKNLEILDMSDNQILILDSSSLASLQELQQVDFSFNHIKAVHESKVLNNGINSINLSNNNITSIFSKAFLSFAGLKELKLAYNMELQDLGTVIFPDHFMELDIANTAVETLNICNLLKLHDLQTLNFNNTRVPCTCQLAHLYDKVHLNPMSSSNNEWKCRNSSDQMLLVHDFHLKCLNENNDCNSNSLSDAVHVSGEITKVDVRLSIVEQKSEEIAIAWEILNKTEVAGYKILVYKSDGEEEVYISDILHPTVSSHVITGSKVKQGNFQVCVQVYGHNISMVSQQKCEDVSVTSLTVYVGVMAGVVFLIPFSIILICIVRFDWLHNKKERLYFAVEENDKDLQTEGPQPDARDSAVALTCDSENEAKITTSSSFEPGSKKMPIILQKDQQQIQDGNQKPKPTISTSLVNTTDLKVQKRQQQQLQEKEVHTQYNPATVKDPIHQENPTNTCLNISDSSKFIGDNPSFVPDENAKHKMTDKIRPGDTSVTSVEQTRLQSQMAVLSSIPVVVPEEMDINTQTECLSSPYKTHM